MGGTIGTNELGAACGGQVNQSLSGNPAYAPWYQPHTCPCCGYCPYCGRGGYGRVPGYPLPWPDYSPPNIGDVPASGMEWNKIYCGQTQTAISGNENKQY